MKTILVLLGIAITLLSIDAAFARGRSSAYDGFFNGPYACDNGRTYQWHGKTMYVDGLAARNGVSYDVRCSGDGSGCSAWENGFKRANCRIMNPPPAAAPAKHWDNYVEVCNGRQPCHWESRQID